jgi:hypothetical protein
MYLPDVADAGGDSDVVFDDLTTPKKHDGTR